MASDRPQRQSVRKAKVFNHRNFSVPQVFNTAYYSDKRPIYLEKIANGEIEVVNWKTATEYLEYDLQVVESVGAYNSMFDYKKAIPFTELYINMLYSPQYYEWEKCKTDLLTA